MGSHQQRSRGFVRGRTGQPLRRGCFAISQAEQRLEAGLPTRDFSQRPLGETSEATQLVEQPSRRRKSSPAATVPTEDFSVALLWSWPAWRVELKDLTQSSRW